MLARVVPLCVVFLLFAAFTPAQDAKKDLEALQGEWTAVSVEQNGKPFPNPKMTLTVDGEKWRVIGPESKNFENKSTITLKIDPSKNPKTMDLTYKIEDKEVFASRGIYKLEGDRLTLCRTTGKNADRPTEFKTTDEGGILVVWKREKK